MLKIEFEYGVISIFIELFLGNQDSGSRFKVKIFSTKSSTAGEKFLVKISRDETKPIVRGKRQIECRQVSNFMVLFRIIRTIKILMRRPQLTIVSWEMFSSSLMLSIETLMEEIEQVVLDQRSNWKSSFLRTNGNSYRIIGQSEYDTRERIKKILMKDTSTSKKISIETRMKELSYVFFEKSESPLLIMLKFQYYLSFRAFPQCENSKVICSSTFFFWKKSLFWSRTDYDSEKKLIPKSEKKIPSRSETLTDLWKFNFFRLFMKINIFSPFFEKYSRRNYSFELRRKTDIF